MIYILYLLFFVKVLALCANTAPIDPSSLQPRYESWVPEPNGRGSFSIIFSCLTTLLFCASKILKPNILPPQWKGRYIQLIQIIAGMFVPELIYLMALGQFCDAKGVRDSMNRKAEDLAQQSQAPKIRRWSIKALWKWFIFEQKPEYIKLVHAGPKWLVQAYFVVLTL